jgi:hypothetical protein
LGVCPFFSPLSRRAQASRPPKSAGNRRCPRGPAVETYRRSAATLFIRFFTSASGIVC